MKIRLHDRVACPHVRSISPENMTEDLVYMFNHNGETNPAAFPYGEFRMDSPEQACPTCGRLWRITE